MSDYSFLSFIKKANRIGHASCRHALSLGLAGDATGGTAVWMQTQISCMAGGRDIKREENSM